MKRTTSFWRVLKHDYPCFMFALAGPIALALALVIFLTGILPSKRGPKAVDPAFATGALVVSMAVTVLFTGLCAARVSRLRRIVAAGREVDATVLGLEFFKDRGRLEFEYEWEGATYQDYHPVMKTRETKDLQPGDALRVAIDPLRPSRAVPVDLFCATGAPGPRPGR